MRMLPCPATITERSAPRSLPNRKVPEPVTDWVSPELSNVTFVEVALPIAWVMSANRALADCVCPAGSSPVDALVEPPDEPQADKPSVRARAAAGTRRRTGTPRDGGWSQGDRHGGRG